MSTVARFPGSNTSFGLGQDNTDRILNNRFLTPAYASTIAITSQKSYVLVQPATLTGAVTFTAPVGTSTTAPFVGDVIEFMLVSDGTSRTATFGTGFLPTGTLSVTTAKFASIVFVFNGTSWIERSRAVTA